MKETIKGILRKRGHSDPTGASESLTVSLEFSDMIQKLSNDTLLFLDWLERDSSGRKVKHLRNDFLIPFYTLKHRMTQDNQRLTRMDLQNAWKVINDLIPGGMRIESLFPNLLFAV